MKMLKLPKDIQSCCLGSGCPNDCWYCYEPKEVIFKGVPPLIKDKIYLYDMNILAYEDQGVYIYDLIDTLGKTKKYFEISSGVEWGRMNLPLACLFRKYRFGRFSKRSGYWNRYMRFAWDGSEKLQYKIKNVFDMFITAGFKPNQIGIFMLVNGKISYEECLRKLDTLKYWGCQIDDCCFDGGYPRSSFEYYCSSKWDGKRYWDYDHIKSFRRACRKHNQKVVRYGIDPELTSIPKKMEDKNEHNIKM